MEPAFEAGDLLIGRFEIVRHLGSGGVGAVFEAVDRASGARTVIKTLRGRYATDPKGLARFRQEAHAAASIHHPNVARVWEFHSPTDHPPFLVMEYIPGQNFQDLIRYSVTLPEERVVKIVVQILHGLAAAHRLGIVHRDLKPLNIMVTTGADDAVKILDFGVARFRDEERRAHLTETGEILGTPGFMAPEQVTGAPIDERTDLFAVGVITYRALTRALPFDGPSPAERVVALLNHAPVPVRTARTDLDDQLARIVDRSIERDPGLRFQSADAMRDALSEWLVTRGMARDAPPTNRHRLDSAAPTGPAPTGPASSLPLPGVASPHRASRHAPPTRRSVRPQVAATRPMLASERPPPPPRSGRSAPQRASIRHLRWIAVAAAGVLAALGSAVAVAGVLHVFHRGSRVDEAPSERPVVPGVSGLQPSAEPQQAAAAASGQEVQGQQTLGRVVQPEAPTPSEAPAFDAPSDSPEPPPEVLPPAFDGIVPLAPVETPVEVSEPRASLRIVRVRSENYSEEALRHWARPLVRAVGQCANHLSAAHGHEFGVGLEFDRAGRVMTISPQGTRSDLVDACLYRTFQGTGHGLGPGQAAFALRFGD